MDWDCNCDCDCDGDCDGDDDGDFEFKCDFDGDKGVLLLEEETVGGGRWFRRMEEDKEVFEVTERSGFNLEPKSIFFSV